MNATEFAPEPPAALPARRTRSKKNTNPRASPTPSSHVVTFPKPELELPGPRSGISDKTKVIVAHIDVGYGNTVYIRGEGGSLSWDVGVPMINADADRWVWSFHADEAPREYKFLRNDRDWEIGENHALTGCDVTATSPKFPD